MEIVRLTEVHNDEGLEYEREETLDGCYYWSRWEECTITRSLERVPLSPEAAERMEARRNGKLAAAGYPGLIELRVEIEDGETPLSGPIRYRRREIMHGGVLWDRGLFNPVGRFIGWQEMETYERIAMEERYQAEYPDDEDNS